MALSVKERLRVCVNALEGYGLPVGFMRYVLDRYDFSIGDQDRVTPFWDSMDLTKATLDDLEAINPLGRAVAGGPGIATIYEEFTHAYFDLKSDAKDPRVVALLGAAKAYYRGAPMKDGSPCDDPERVTQEAVGEYVGGRAQTYWIAYTNLARYTAQSLSRLTRERMEWFLRRTEENYDKGMAASVHGYQERGSLWWKSQVHTTKKIHPGLKQYGDAVLLEKKLSVNFRGHPRLAALLAQVRKRMAAAGLVAPTAPARAGPLRLAPNRR